jgi:hypothetical protein
MSVFSCLVVLDNKTAGTPIQSRVTDFALYLQEYENHEKRMSYSPKDKVQINLSYTLDGDLHDEFSYYLQDKGESLTLT